MLADLDHAGDEPLMLARQLPEVPVLVSADRYLAGQLAERTLGCTVHVLDDGFQHFELERDVDLVLLSPEEVERPATLPSGRLREPIDVVRAAVRRDRQRRRRVSGLPAVGATVGVRDVFRLERRLDRPRPIEASATSASRPDAGARVLAVAGIAQPGPVFRGRRGRGLDLVGARWRFADHHRFARADIDRIAAAMRSGAARELVLTTEKDVVRLEPLCPLPVRRRLGAAPGERRAGAGVQGVALGEISQSAIGRLAHRTPTEVARRQPA